MDITLLNNTIHFLDDLADTLDNWARSSRLGGWSTHQVDANMAKANDCRRQAAALRQWREDN